MGWWGTNGHTCLFVCLDSRLNSAIHNVKEGRTGNKITEGQKKGGEREREIRRSKSSKSTFARNVAYRAKAAVRPLAHYIENPIFVAFL